MPVRITARFQATLPAPTAAALRALRAGWLGVRAELSALAGQGSAPSLPQNKFNNNFMATVVRLREL